MRCTGIGDLPGFRESLELLLVDEGYALSDVAAMFGVSRERIRQLAKKLGIAVDSKTYRGLFQVRVWDDVAHRFRPASRGQMTRARAAAVRAAGREQRERWRQARRAWMVAEVRGLAARLDRVPTLAEVLRALRPDCAECPDAYAGAFISGMWAGGGRDRARWRTSGGRVAWCRGRRGCMGTFTDGRGWWAISCWRRCVKTWTEHSCAGPGTVRCRPSGSSTSRRRHMAQQSDDADLASAAVEAAVASSGMAARQFAERVLGVNERTVRYWIARQRAVPDLVVRVCEAIVQDPPGMLERLGADLAP